MMMRNDEYFDIKNVLDNSEKMVSIAKEQGTRRAEILNSLIDVLHEVRIEANWIDPKYDDDKTWQMRHTAAQLLGKIGDPQSVDPLIDRVLYDPSAIVRKSAALALADIGDPRTIPVLINVLGQVGSYGLGNIGVLDNGAAEALARFGDASAGPLIVALQHSYRATRQEAARALGLSKCRDAVESLIAGLKDTVSHDGYSSVSICAAEALGSIGDERAINPLLDQLLDSWGNERSTVVEALTSIGIRTIPAILARLDVWKERKCKGGFLLQDYYPVEDIVEILGNVGDTTAVEPLLKFRTHESIQVRRSVVLALAKIGSQQCLEGIAGFLSDSDYEVSSTAEQALKKNSLSKETDDSSA